MKSLYKIVHTACGYGYGEIEKRIFNESVWMEQNGHKIIIAAPADTPLYLKAKKQGLKVYDVRFKTFSMRKDYLQLKHIFYHEKPWVVNVHSDKDARLALPAAKKIDIPLRVLTRHSSSRVRDTWMNRRLYKKWSHYVFTTADCTTIRLKSDLSLNNMQVFTMPGGIGIPETLMEKEDARLYLARKLEQEETVRFMGFSGCLSKEKGLPILLKAFSKIKSGFTDYRLVISGEGKPSYVDSLKQMADKLNIREQVIFIGFQEDPWSFYRAIDCMILPSKNIRNTPFEGVPLDIAEAMYSQTPVIGSKSGGITEIIENGKTGLLFDPDSPSDLADKISEVLNNSEMTRSFVEAAREKMEKKYTMNVLGRNIIRIYRLHQVRMEKNNFVDPRLIVT